MKSRPTVIGITLGDLNGIGPETAWKAVHARGAPTGTRYVLIGDPAALPTTPPGWAPDRSTYPTRRVTVWNPAPSLRVKYRPGAPHVDAARAAHAWILAAVDAARQGVLDAIVTAPINKEGFMKAGIDAPGHTELLAARTGVKRFDMMLLADDFRVVLATRHIPLRNVSDALTVARIREAISLTADALPWLGCRTCRIAVCGLNPHAGDGGAIGDEERRIIAPALKGFNRKGCAVTGPLPADTVFHQQRHGAFDAIIAMYHDQGLAPFKMMAFERGVNLTLGLPIVRTSPDHGTAYDLAGRDAADPSSMREAVALAVTLARRRNPWRLS